MKHRILAVMPECLNYPSHYQVSVAKSFDEAQKMIEQAELLGIRLDSLDIPANNEEAFWEFLNWMQSSGRNYPFSVFGISDTDRFWALCEECRSRGFHFNT